ncbi:LysR family transcriptional regulator [Achromobacter sp. DH1f]|uniref:LysR family transcriptional regulator n=1 Tax=Achromobacter sp. DH1f TaxID=1397275 RepID=UPI000469DD97|nr:LysR family transcriptional regulator [Achromobacter sp. DH1f]
MRVEGPAVSLPSGLGRHGDEAKEETKGGLPMDINRLDLNLLKIFDSVYRLRNLSEVAKEVNLSQPAVSHALGRLREALNDRLFVRSPGGFEPTERCERLAPPVRAALETIKDSLMDSSNFRPEDCNREFRLLLSDVGEMLLVPALMSRLREIAPRVKLAIFQAPRVNYEQMLQDRKVDIAVGHLNMLRQTMRKQSLFQDGCVVLRREQVGRSKPLTREVFEQSYHVMIMPPDDPVEEGLANLNVSRNVTLRIPNYFALPEVIGTSDLLATVPSRIGRYLGGRASLDIYPVPFPEPVFDVHMYWHMRHDDDQAHTWLREIFLELFQSPT